MCWINSAFHIILLVFLYWKGSNSNCNSIAPWVARPALCWVKHSSRSVRRPFSRKKRDSSLGISDEHWRKIKPMVGAASCRWTWHPAWTDFFFFEGKLEESFNPSSLQVRLSGEEKTHSFRHPALSPHRHAYPFNIATTEIFDSEGVTVTCTLFFWRMSVNVLGGFLFTSLHYKQPWSVLSVETPHVVPSDCNGENK